MLESQIILIFGCKKTKGPKQNSQNILLVSIKKFPNSPIIYSLSISRIFDLLVGISKRLSFFDLRPLITPFTAPDYPFGILDLRPLITPLVS